MGSGGCLTGGQADVLPGGCRHSGHRGMLLGQMLLDDLGWYLGWVLGWSLGSLVLGLGTWALGLGSDVFI